MFRDMMNIRTLSIGFVLLCVSGLSLFANTPPSYLMRPLGETGETEAYRYVEDADRDGFYEVTLVGQEEVPVFITGETLNLIITSPVPDAVRAALISQYPHRMIDMYNHVLNTYYPDDADAFRNNPFPGWEDLAEGVWVTQDPYAPNYVRVRARNAEGNLEEFSVSRHTWDEMQQAGIEEGTWAAALADFPYRMPEQARYAFNSLTRDEFIAMVETVPAVARQEFVQVKRIYLNPDEPMVEAAPAFAEPLIPAVEEEEWAGEPPPLAPPLEPRRTTEARAKPTPAPETPAVEVEEPDAEGGFPWWIIGVIILIGAAVWWVRSAKPE